MVVRMGDFRHIFSSKRVSIVSASLGAVGLVMAGFAPASIAVAAPPAPSTVTVSDVANARPAAGGWWQDRDDTSAGSFAITADSFDNSDAAKLILPTTSAGINLHDSYPTASRPTDLPALLNGAGYSYTGTNVNFQVEVAFHPADPQYAATGATPCTSAASWGIPGVDASACYVLFKWEPFATTTAWTSVDLGADTAGNSGTVPTPTGGWIAQKRVGAIPPTAARVGHTMTDYLAQMSDYQVVSYGFGAGSGAVAPTAGWVKDITFGGTTQIFAPAAIAPAPAPVADSSDLASYISTNDIDVAATSSTFSIGDEPAGAGLTAVDATKPLDASLPWVDASDSFVDVYAYSSPTFLGTFPVQGGAVVMNGADLGALQAGGHHLVFLGQTSGTVSIVAFTVAAAGAGGAATGDPTLAVTGVDGVGPAIGGIFVLLVGLGAIGFARLRRNRRSA
jgi:hypothetical protein